MELQGYNDMSRKRKHELSSERKKQKSVEKELDNEVKILNTANNRQTTTNKNKKDETEEITKKIRDGEKQILELQQEESQWIKKIKFLSSCRERMARNASQAMSEARARKQELKVKELLILDLAKKLQETEFKLKSYVALYEEVKNARNKYVASIQNSSQNLAEMKERIKIVQNEVEILRNESVEKDKALTESRHGVQVEI